MMSDEASGYTAYQRVGWGAELGERENESSWDDAVRRRQQTCAELSTVMVMVTNRIDLDPILD